jgi:alpha-1,2-glucosyltransferase
MHAEAPNLAAAKEPSNEASTLWRDPGLLTAVACTLALKLLFAWILVGGLRHLTLVQHLRADLGSWNEFIKAVRAGALPYVQVPCDAPVLAGSYYWLLSKLSVALPYGPRPVLLHSTVLMGVADLVSCGVFYRLVRDIDARSALRASLVLSCTLTGLLLGPTHLDPLIVSCLLIAYRMYTTGRCRSGVAMLSVLAGLTPFGTWLFAAQILQAVVTRRPRREWLQALAIFGAVQLALHAPFVLAGWSARDALGAFLSSLAGARGEPAGFVPDTALGFSRLWLGHFALHDAAAWLCVATAGFALVRVRHAELPRAIVVLAIATMLFRPNAGSSWQLWLYPFLLLIALQAAPQARAWLLVATLMLDLSNVLANPFIWPQVQSEIGSLDPGAAVERGAAWTLIFSVSVLAKLALLIALLRTFARAPLPTAAAPTPLTWPRVDLSSILPRLNQPSVALWLAGAIVVGQSLFTASSMLHVRRYSDEGYHAEQVERYCKGQTDLREGITMLPGYHIITAAIANWRDDCSLERMRKQNVIWGVCATLFALLILRSLGAHSPATRTLSFHFLPVLFPYHFLVYTDVFAVVLTLLALYLAIQRYWAVAGFVAAVSIAVRQTNALVLVLLVMLALFETARTSSYWNWLKLFLAKSWTSLLGLIGFAIFVYRNGGVAVGDRDSHQLGLHIGNVVFVLLLLALVALPVNLERIWRERDRLVRVGFGLSLAALYFAYMYLFKVDHAYNQQHKFLRNVLVMWASSNMLTKTLFFAPIAVGFAALWTTPLVRRSYWIWVPVFLLGLLPESLIEQRYAIVPLSLWMLMRRDGTPFAETLTALSNLAVSMWLLQHIVSGQGL